MIKLLWCRFEQSLGTFTMLLFESSSVISKIQKLWGSSLFSQHSKFKQDFENAAKKREKVFTLWDYCIWIGITKFSLLRTGYLSSGANVLTSSQRFYILIRETFFHSIDFAVINEYDKGTVMQISTVLWHGYYVACSNRTFSKFF